MQWMGTGKNQDYISEITSDGIASESIRFTFNGWDGKSYDGESRSARVYRTSLPGYEEVKLIKVGKHLCYIDEERSILEKATGESHPEAEWLVEVERA